MQFYWQQYRLCCSRIRSSTLAYLSVCLLLFRWYVWMHNYLLTFMVFSSSFCDSWLIFHWIWNSFTINLRLINLQWIKILNLMMNVCDGAQHKITDTNIVTVYLLKCMLYFCASMDSIDFSPSQTLYIWQTVVCYTYSFQTGGCFSELTHCQLL